MKLRLLITLIITAVVLFFLGWGLFFLSYKKESRQVNSQIEQKRPTANRLRSEIDYTRYASQSGQLFVVALSGRSMSEQETKWLKEASVSGVFLLSKSISNEKQLKNLIIEVKDAVGETGAMPLVAIDQEGGRVSRVPWVSKVSPGDLDSGLEVAVEYKLRSRQLRDLGFNMNFAPTVEMIASGSAFMVRQGRLFADYNYVDDAVRMSLEYDVVPVAKHFPGGLGEIAADPHKQLPVYEAEYDWQTEKGLRLAIATGVPAVMVTHILYPQYDDWPASASEYFVREVLREKMKFAGLVIVDDLSMGAVAEVADVGEYATASIEAGGELLLFSVQDDYLEAYAEINRRVEIDPEFAEMVGERVYHVLRWKEEYLRE